MDKNQLESFCPASREEWRGWLANNHDKQRSVWVIAYKKKSNVPSIVWSDAVDEALCFGWIDSLRKPVDDDKFIQFFCQRKPKSGWSKINKIKVQRLIADGLMEPAGYQSIETAQQNGSWTILDEVEELTIPADLAQAFDAQQGARDYFVSLSKSVRKSILQWIVLARRPETRQSRIAETAQLAAQQQKPKPF